MKKSNHSALLSGKIIATRDMGYSLPLLTQNFCFSSAHYAKIAKLARASLRQSQFFGSIRWENQQNFARRSRKQPISLEFVCANCLPDSSDHSGVISKLSRCGDRPPGRASARDGLCSVSGYEGEAKFDINLCYLIFQISLSFLLFFSLSFSPSLGLASEVEKDQSLALCTARAAVQTTVLHGYTRARWRRFLICEEPGRCLEVRAEMGDLIVADGLFAQLDTTFIDLELEANQAARARLENQRLYWHREVKRYRKLSGQKAVSETRVQELELKYDQARLTLVELKVKAAVLKERRRRCLVKAPAGWHLLARKVEPGEWLTMGQVVGQVGDYRTLLVPFSLTRAQYVWLKKQETLSLLLPSLVRGQPSLEVPVNLLHVSPAFDQTTRKIKVELEISAGLPEMRGGLSLELAIDLPEAGGVVEVPTTAVIERYGAFWLVRENGAEVKVVKLGQAANGDFRVVGDQVKAGDRFRCH